MQQKYKNGATQAELAREYNISPASVAWHAKKHLLQEKPLRTSHPPAMPTRTIVVQESKPKLITLESAPTSEHKLVQGTQVLDLKTRDLYVQVSADENTPLWVLIERQKKGLLSSVVGWFKKT